MKFVGALRSLTFMFLLAVPVVSQDIWQKIENGSFSFPVPLTLKKTKLRGKDSFVEEYIDREIKIIFDYGLYSNNFGDWPKETKFEYLMIDGKSARIGTAKEEFRDGFPFSTQVYFKLDKYTALSMFAACKSEKEVSIARKIFETIRFKN